MMAVPLLTLCVTNYTLQVRPQPFAEILCLFWELGGASLVTGLEIEMKMKMKMKMRRLIVVIITISWLL